MLVAKNGRVQFEKAIGEANKSYKILNKTDTKFNIALRSNKLLSPEYTKILFEERPELNVSFHSYGFFLSNSEVGRVASHKGDVRGINCQFKMFLDSGYTVVVLSNYSQPSANIVANVIDQMITHKPD